MKREEIEHLAALARIELTEREETALSESITDILEYVSAVNEIVREAPEKRVGAVYNVMREDVESHEPGEHTEAILEAAPSRKGQYVKVKKIITNDE